MSAELPGLLHPIRHRFFSPTAVDAAQSRSQDFPHRRLTGFKRYRLRVGDYRVIYTLDLAREVIHLLAVGHRREIYKQA